MRSIKELGSLFRGPWKKKIVRLSNGIFSLDGIEHGIIRPEFQDPRIHFAVNRASRSCPPLASRPYTGENLDEQLDAVTRSLLNDPERTRLEGDRLYLSKIFDWYAEDFGDPVRFVLRYAQGDLQTRLRACGAGGRPAYLDYDWSLNQVPSP